MARTADAVVIEVETRLNQAQSRSTEAQVETSVNRMVASAGKAEAAIAQSSKKVELSLKTAGGAVTNLTAQQYRLLQGIGEFARAFQIPEMSQFQKDAIRAANSSQLLGTQIGNIGARMASGSNPFTAIAQGGIQVASAMRLSSMGMATLGGVLGGVFVTAALAAAGALAELIVKQFKQGESIDDLVKKIREKTKQTRLAEEADAVFGQTLDGVTEALRKNEEAINKVSDAQKSQIRSSLEAALAAADRLQIIRGEIAANIAYAKSLLAVQQARASGPTQAAEMVSLGLAGQSEAIAALEQSLADTDTQIAKAHAQIQETRARFVAEVVTENIEGGAEGRVKREADKMVAAEIERIKATKLVGDALDAEIAKRTQIIRLQEQASLDAIREAKRKKKPTDHDLVMLTPPVSGFTIPRGGQLGADRPGARVHAGVDLSGLPLGTPVSAPGGGRVMIETGVVPGYGNVVYIDHGRGTISRLGHLQSIMVKPNQIVEEGQQVGTLGQTGNATGPTVHWEVRTGGKAIDPLKTKVPVDPGAVSDAGRAAREAKQAADLAARQTAAFNREMRELEASLTTAMQGRVASAEAQLQIAERAVVTAMNNDIAAYKEAEATGRLAVGAAKLLAIKRREVATAEVMALYNEEGLRKASTNRQLTIDAQNAKIDQLRFEADNTKTTEARRDALLRVLVAEQELERLTLLDVIATEKIGSTKRLLAEAALARLNAETGRKAATIIRDTKTPGEQFASDLNDTGERINEELESVAVDGLQRLNDGLTEAIMGTKSLAEAFRAMAEDIISQLIRIAIQQLIIKPMANLLFGGGFGGDFGFGAGGGYDAANANLVGMAGGGSVTGGTPYMVGEQGPELFVPSQSGMIIPNGDLARMGSGAGAPAEVVVRVVRGEMFEAHVERVAGPVAVRVVAATAPQVTDMAMAKTTGRLGRVHF